MSALSPRRGVSRSDREAPTLAELSRTLGLTAAADVEVNGGRWRLDTVAGRLIELSAAGGGGALSLLTALVVEAQHAGEPVAWVCAGRTTFYPPDLADAGVDVGALPVVTVDELVAAAQVADELLRSGAFGLLVIDVGDASVSSSRFDAAGSQLHPGADRGRGYPRRSGRVDVPRLALPVETRLAGLAQKHHVAVVFLTATPRTAPSVGTLVSLRGESRIERLDGGEFRVELQVVKDKERGPGWRHHETRRGPDGLG